VTVFGARDVDVGIVESEASTFEGITNASRGGDIFLVEATGDVGTVATRQGGNIGAIFTSSTNSTLIAPPFITGVGGVRADGSVNLIRTGTMAGANTEIGGSLFRVDFGRGGLRKSDFRVDGNLDFMTGSYAYKSDVWVGGSGRSVRFGSQGARWSMFNYVGGIDSASFTGGFIDSEFNSLDDSGTTPLGGRIGLFTADEVSNSDFEALGGFANFSVRGPVVDTEVITRFFSGVDSEEIGAGIDRLRTGYVIDSFFDVFTDIRSLNTGALIETDFEIGGDLVRGLIRGDMLESDLEVGGNVNRLEIQGDLLNDGAEIEVDGNSNVLIVRGSLSVGGGIEIGGDSTRLIVVGGGTEGSDIEVDGNSTLMVVGFLDDGTDVDIGGNSTRLFVGQIHDGDIDVGGDSGVIVIAGVASDSFIEVDGNAEQILIGKTADGTEVEVGGDLGTLRISRASQLDDIFIGGSAGIIIIGGDRGGIDGDFDDLEVGGDLRMLRFNAGLVEYDVEVDGDVAVGIFFGGGLSQVEVDVEGRLPRFTVMGSAEDLDLEADGGFGNVTFLGALVDSDIESRSWDPTTGEPTGGGIRSLRIGGTYDLDIDLHSDLQRVVVAKAFKDVDIDLTARDDFGSGDIVGGGGVGTMSTYEFIESSLRSYRALGRVSIGLGGVGPHSSFQTLSEEEGDIRSFRSRGLFFGDLLAARNLGFFRHAGGLTDPLAPFDSPLDGETGVDFETTDGDNVPIGGTIAARLQIEF
jgi:hypothetical protein